MKKIILFVLASLSGLSLSAQFTGKMNFTSMGETRSFTVHSADTGYRYDFDEDGQKGAVIVKNGSGEVIILMPQQKMAMKSPSDSPMSMSNDPLKSMEYYQKSGIMKEEGKEMVNGVPCTKSTLYNAENPSQKLFTLWVSNEYKFPMKMLNHIDGTENSGMEMSGVEPWTPVSQFFEIPADYQVMEMPVMPGETEPLKPRKMKHRKVMLSILLLAICISTQAQQLVTATGGNASGSGGTVSYSIGQVVYHSHTGTNGSVLEGIQQPYEISVLTVLEEAEGINLLVLVYPNPTTDFLQLKVESDNLNDLTYQLLNMQGKLLENEQITGNQTSIAMSNLAQGTYFVKIIQGSRVIKTFKVVKTE